MFRTSDRRTRGRAVPTLFLNHADHMDIEPFRKAVFLMIALMM